MKTYESVLVVDDALGQDDIDTLIGELKTLVEKYGATAVETQPWGRKKLAYEIKDKHYAHFVFFRFTAPGNVPDELEQHLRIEKRVLRYQTFLYDGEVDPKAVHFKNFEKLANYITDRGKIRPRRSNRFNAAEQRILARQISRARVLGLLPFTTVGS